ncbi:MAG: hypothetical protein A3G87_03405 [Omnitrophica bacterium RIFCSPLOWO2_12_FULL_50_11]|nr:MAG: hypothetical protein A3G87_03405 [Omnitrophica bacterium RIFCSPLOWO2_12_FULL_50_11]
MDGCVLQRKRWRIRPPAENVGGSLTTVLSECAKWNESEYLTHSHPAAETKPNSKEILTQNDFLCP